jgi:hypothetical protein
MRRVLQTVSWLALLGTILPSVFYLSGWIDLEQSQRLLLVATLAWFVHAPMWMGRGEEQKEEG